MSFSLSARAIDARKARDVRDRLKYSTHVSGRCGMDVGACCHECYSDERAEMLAWAMEQPDALPGEDVGAYWRRIGGSFLDAWHDVASERMRTVRSTIESR